MANYSKANRACILVADDAAIDRSIVRMLLRREFEVEEAVDGLDAVKHMEANPDRYACVLLDMLMPVMDGFKVMRYMQEHGLLERIPVIALTAISDAEGHIRCFESGALDVIEKPYDEQMLLYKLKFDISRFRRLQGLEKIGTESASAPVAAAHSMIDTVRQHVKATLGIADEEMPEFIGTFMESFGECANRLKEMGEPPDYQVIREVTHKIYGFAQNMGAFDLNDAALLLNAAAKQSDAAACVAGIRLVTKLYGECLTATK